jgi:probable phosphoglycerate mutase
MGWDRATIYFVRHGQTDWNAEGRFQGHRDVPLNDTGRAQAARNGAALAGVIANPAAFDFVASPLGRASETMEIIRRALGLAPAAYRTDPRLREIHVGAHEGWLTRDVSAHRASDPWHFRHPGEGGESYAMLAARVLDWLAGVKHDTVVAAHGGVMRCLRRHVEGLNPEEVFTMPVPQDKVMAIREGAIDWL